MIAPEVVSLRAHLAGMIAAAKVSGDSCYMADGVARAAVELADALVAELERRAPPVPAIPLPPPVPPVPGWRP